MSDEFLETSLARCVLQGDSNLALLALEQGESPFVRKWDGGFSIVFRQFQRYTDKGDHFFREIRIHFVVVNIWKQFWPQPKKKRVFFLVLFHINKKMIISSSIFLAFFLLRQWIHRYIYFHWHTLFSKHKFWHLAYFQLAYKF